jgi:hypothetical protein
MARLVRLLAVVSLMLLLPVTAYSTGKIKGRVVDRETKDPLAGANVVLVGTTYGAATGLDGEFVIVNVPEGTYAMRSSYIGYAALTVENVRVNFNLTTEVLFELTPAQISVRPVLIVAERPLINKNSTNAARIVTSTDMSTLPIRGVENVLAIQAGVVLQDGVIHVRGGRADEVGVQLDGVTIADPVSGGRRLTLVQDAVEEISLQSSGYEAEFGRANSGIVQYVLKTGSPSFKGTLEYITDNIGFQSSNGFTKGTKRLGAYWYGYNEFTGTVSGPVIDERFKFFGLFNYLYQRDKMPQAYSGIDIGAIKDPISQDSIYLIYPAGVLLKNSNEMYTFTGTANADLLPLKIRLSGSYSKIRSNDGATLAVFDMDRVTESNMWQGFGSLKATYVISPTTFAEVSGGLFKNFAKTYDPVLKDDFLSYGDSVVNAQAGYIWPRRPGTPTGRYVIPMAYNLYGWSFNVPGTPIASYSKNQRDNITLTAALTGQVGRYHTFKLGGDYLRYTVRSYQVSRPANLALLVARNDTASAANKQTLQQILTPNVFAYGYDVLGNELSSLDYLGPRHPVFASAYAQDKIEFGDLVLNLGLRYDYIDADSYQLLDPSLPDLAVQPGTLAILPDGLVHSKPLSLVTPRFGAAFSLTDKIVFHAQFAKLIQQSRLLDAYLPWRQFALNVTGIGYIPTNLGPVRTTQYEVGISQQLGESASLDVTAYYKDVYDQTKPQLVSTPLSSTGAAYFDYTNGDYTTTKGIELSFQMRRVHRLQANATVSLQDGQGSGSYAFQGGRWYLMMQQMIVPLDYNNKVRGSAFIDYRFASDEGGAVLQGAGANLLFTFSSGHPYTRVANDAWQLPLEALNSSSTPWWFQADLRVEKMFRLTSSILSTAYISVINLFDVRNVTNVWATTGSAADDGYLVNPTSGEKLVASKGQPYADLYRQVGLNYYQPNADGGLVTSYRYGPPRQIRIGLRLEY